MKRSEAQAFIAAFVAMRDSATDEQALKCISIYPEWKPGSAVKEGSRLRYGDTLYRVKDGQGHTTQSDWTPDVAASLFEKVNVSNTGTLKDPIPYEGNMILESGKYYIQSEVVYLCTRDTGIAVYNALSDLVGLYVEMV